MSGNEEEEVVVEGRQADRQEGLLRSSRRKTRVLTPKNKFSKLCRSFSPLCRVEAGEGRWRGREEEAEERGGFGGLERENHIRKEGMCRFVY